MVRNAEIEWRDELRGAPPLVLSALDLRLRNSGRRASRSASPRSRRPSSAASVELRAADRRAPACATDGLERARVMQSRLHRPRRLARLDGLSDQHRAGPGRAARLGERGERRSRRPDRGPRARRGVRASLGDELSPLELASLQGRVQGRRLADGVELSGQRLALAMDARPGDPADRLPDRLAAAGRAACSPRAWSTWRRSASWSSRCRCRRSSPACSPSSGRAAGSPTRAWNGAGRSTRRAGFSRAQPLQRARAAGPRDEVPGFTGLSGSFELSKRARQAAARRAQGARSSCRRCCSAAAHRARLARRPVEWERDAAGALTRAHRLAHLLQRAISAATRTAPMSGAATVRARSTCRRCSTAPTARSVARYLPHGRSMGGEAREWLKRPCVAGQCERRARARARRPARVSVRRSGDAASSASARALREGRAAVRGRLAAHREHRGRADCSSASACTVAGAQRHGARRAPFGGACAGAEASRAPDAMCW